MDLSTAKAFLQRKEGNSSTYEHLTELVMKLLIEQPENALANLEQFSASLKSATFPVISADSRSGGAFTEALAAAKFAHLKSKESLFAPNLNEDGEPIETEPVQDFTDDANLLQWSGVSFGQTESYNIHLALKRVAARFNARNVRFFGKIFGTESDYFIVEAIVDADSEEETTVDALGNTIQPSGEGPNKYTYFVSSSIDGEWTKLPNVTPHQIIVARKIRRFLSGRLDNSVGGHPPFPGSEGSYLRALIALISAATVIVPSGVYQAVEDSETGQIEPNGEEFEFPDLSTADGWVHRDLSINNIGRTRPNPPKIDEEGNEVEDEDAPEPSVPLSAISEDPNVSEEDEGNGAWDIRNGAAVAAADNGPTVLRSLRFPGAVTVGSGKRYASVYVGFGHEVILSPYQPQLPEALPAEYDFNAEDELVREKEDVIEDPSIGQDEEEE